MGQKPLLEPGLHDFKLDDIGNHFLESFPDSTTRSDLIHGFREYVGHLSSFGVPIEVWIDGSFTTDKLNPNDIDLVVFSPAANLNALSEDKQLSFRALLDQPSIKRRFGCDVYFSPTENKEMRSYWRGWYGFDRNEQPKGIARVMVAI